MSVISLFRHSKWVAWSVGRLRWFSGLVCFFCQEISFLALIRQDHGLLIHPHVFYLKPPCLFFKVKIEEREKGTHFAHALNKALNNFLGYYSVCPFTSPTPCNTSDSLKKCEISIFACKLAQQHLNIDWFTFKGFSLPFSCG